MSEDSMETEISRRISESGTTEEIINSPPPSIPTLKEKAKETLLEKTEDLNNGKNGSIHEKNGEQDSPMQVQETLLQNSEEEEGDDDIPQDQINEKEEENNSKNKSPEKTPPPSNGSPRKSRRKTPLKTRLDDCSDDEELNDVEEVKDEDEEIVSKPKTSSKINVVTIDNVKTLQKLAHSRKSLDKRNHDSNKNTRVIDTEAILAGKSTTGVTITPARVKQPPSKSSKQTVTAAAATAPSKEISDPNLTDDTFVVEAPSFIVPYVYEKPPKETFSSFKDSIKELQEERSKLKVAEKAKKKEAKEEYKRKKKEEDPDYASSKDDSSDESSDSDVETIVPKSTTSKKTDNFFESSLGKFMADLGMNLVQETVQHDLLKQQIRKSQKDKSAGVMHAIMSLKKNLETSRETNTGYHFDLKRCRICSFKTESDLALAYHYEIPHLKNNVYRCNQCDFETKIPNDVLTHMMAEHGVRGKLERAPSLHQCPQCPFEDNMKGKLTRHKTGCDKRFRPERNQEPSFDWEPPAKIPKPPNIRGGSTAYRPNSSFPGSLSSASGLANSSGLRPPFNKGIYPNMPQLHLAGSAAARGRARAMSGISNLANRQMVGGQFMNNQVVLQSLNQGRGTNQSVLLPKLASSGSITIQSVNQRSARASNSPSISITPLPGRGASSSNNSRPSSAMKPGQPNTGHGKGNLVICEICDGFIKDLEQLRNHMQWIHKVKIHPKMIYNRPPLNCQKCQYRFFTDQGLERHLLGSHGLVTASMQDLANKGQDSGRCPVCGKVYQWKLLNHVAKDHQKTLKPAHLSYKCTVCTATFGQYKQFENHVYTAHSGAGKKGDKSKLQKQQATKHPNSTPEEASRKKDETTTKKEVMVSEKTEKDSSSKKRVLEPTVAATKQEKKQKGSDEGVEEIEEDDDDEDEH